MPQMKLQINYASAILASGIGFVLALQAFHLANNAFLLQELFVIMKISHFGKFSIK